LPGWLDLDYFGAKISEQLAAKRPRQERAKLDDAQAGERASDGFARLGVRVGHSDSRVGVAATF
jgi:hypothetical protein